MWPTLRINAFTSPLRSSGDERHQIAWAEKDKAVMCSHLCTQDRLSLTISNGITCHLPLANPTLTKSTDAGAPSLHHDHAESHFELQLPVMRDTWPMQERQNPRSPGTLNDHTQIYVIACQSWLSTAVAPAVVCCLLFFLSINKRLILMHFHIEPMAEG
jgi:hypothetical protein